MNQQQRDAIFSILKKQNPKPTTELVYKSHFELLVAVMLSAQATDIGVNKATQKLFAVANTPAVILALGENTLRSYIKTIGLFNSKAKHVMQTCQILVTQHEGRVPVTREALQALPGVGRKTANVILNTAFGEPTIAVDTHVYRVAKRIGLAKGKTPIQVEAQLLKAISPEYLYNAHHWLILHGRYVCVARKPKCWQCPIVDYCEYKDKDLI